MLAMPRFVNNNGSKGELILSPMYYIVYLFVQPSWFSSDCHFTFPHNYAAFSLSRCCMHVEGGVACETSNEGLIIVFPLPLYTVGMTNKAAEAAATYLALEPSDEVMASNIRFYISNLKVSPENFTPWKVGWVGLHVRTLRSSNYYFIVCVCAGFSPGLFRAMQHCSIILHFPLKWPQECIINE